MDLVEAHQGIILKICTVYAERREEREDLRQEILMQLWRSFRAFRGDSRFSTWMYRVALNTALLTRRARGRRPRSTPLLEAEPVATNPSRSGPDVERLHRCIRELRELDRALILLHLEQHSYQEIAELLGLTPGNVSVRIVRIKKRLRTCLLAPVRTEG